MSMILVLSIPTVTFAGSCNPGRIGDGNHSWEAWIFKATSGYFDGVSGTILNQNPYVSLNSSASSWIMLENPNGMYIQVGWMDLNIGQVVVRNAFAEWDFHPNSGTYDGRKTWADWGVGVYRQFQLTYAAGSDRFDISLDSPSSGPDLSVQNGGLVPTWVAFSSETGSSADQMPGSTADPVWFRSLRQRKAGTWYIVSPSYSPPNSYQTTLDSHPTWHALSRSGDTLRTWDRYC